MRGSENMGIQNKQKSWDILVQSDKINETIYCIVKGHSQ